MLSLLPSAVLDPHYAWNDCCVPTKLLSACPELTSKQGKAGGRQGEGRERAGERKEECRGKEVEGRGKVEERQKEDRGKQVILLRKGHQPDAALITCIW